MTDPAQPNERHDVKKRGVGGAAPGGALRLTVRALGELLGGMAESSAEAFRGLNEKLGSHAGEAASLRGVGGLGSDLVDGLAEGNARFLEGMAQASRKAYEHLKAGEERAAASATPESIDYERLARLVAIELQKADKKG